MVYTLWSNVTCSRYLTKPYDTILLNVLMKEYLSAYVRDGPSLSNILHHSYLARELCLVYERYCLPVPNQSEIASLNSTGQR